MDRHESAVGLLSVPCTPLFILFLWVFFSLFFFLLSPSFASPSPPCQEVKPTFLNAGRANAIKADDALRLRHITCSMKGSNLSQMGEEAGTTDDDAFDPLNVEDPPSNLILKAALLP